MRGDSSSKFNVPWFCEVEGIHCEIPLLCVLAWTGQTGSEHDKVGLPVINYGLQSGEIAGLQNFLRAPLKTVKLFGSPLLKNGNLLFTPISMVKISTAHVKST